MLSNAAEASFHQGLEAFNADQYMEATALFEASIELERRTGAAQIQPRYLSYYGVCLAVYSERVREGVYFCRESIAREGYNADLHLNHARSLLAAGKLREAYEALYRGLGFQPRHPRILRTLKSMGFRKRPVLPFLSRQNGLNVTLGKMLRSR
jgi:tetratricopeptide (TPR) repeat protein